MEESVPYLIALPEGYAADKTDRAGGGHGWPLVLFLHGAGERGTDLQAVTRNGLAKLVADGKPFPFAVLAPQCPKDGWWDAATLRSLVLTVQQQYGLDADRTYVTGLSMGGFGTWDLISRYPDLFAAAVPVCGGGNPIVMQYAGRPKTLPVWAFHGEKDNVVNVQLSRDMIGALTAAKDPNVKLTVYPGVGHDSWTRAYAEPDLYTWMLAQRRGSSTPPPATRP